MDNMGKLCAQTVDRDLTVMLPIDYPFFNPFNLIPILVADVGEQICAWAQTSVSACEYSISKDRTGFSECGRNIKRMEDQTKTSLENMNE
jgi:hypothetical protein